MASTKIQTCVTGFPSIGENRELKWALEKYWSGQIPFEELESTAAALRKAAWLEQKSAGIDYISCCDSSLYDRMLDTAVMFGAVPERFASIEDPAELYFAMARGNSSGPAMEMTKWFNTNYHYIMPELKHNQAYECNSSLPVSRYREAISHGIVPRVNIIGPATFLALSRRTDGGRPIDLLPVFIPLYKKLLEDIASAANGRVLVQIEEPVAVSDTHSPTPDVFRQICDALAEVKGVDIIFSTYFDHATEAVKALRDVPLYGIALDFVYGPENLEALEYLNGKKLFAGVVNGRNIWKNNYSRTLALYETISRKVAPENIVLSTSCSLQHVPYSLRSEDKLDQQVRERLSFAVEKLHELAGLSNIISGNVAAGSNGPLADNRAVFQSRSALFEMSADDEAARRSREGSRMSRKTAQKALNLPLLPSTTIGSFPQTPALRALRRDYKKGVIRIEEYDLGIKNYIHECIVFQEEAGLDVLVHGEPERNDMVEYFGEQLEGFAFTSNGWVQSYGSRCVKPPVIYGSAARFRPMTVDIIKYAQSLTSKPVKGMLTGPVTILNWSFARDDVPREKICQSIAAAISEEIDDLQRAGIRIIQVDEAAFKEGYPLRRSKREDYEKWAVECFRDAVSTARPETQIHTHMCYSDFSDIFDAIEALDADVISIETSRSGNDLLRIFEHRGYAGDIGPGVYDIHSPRVPSQAELEEEINSRLVVVPAESLWVNPDCGLKTRKWEEVKPAIRNMAAAAVNARKGVVHSG